MIDALCAGHNLGVMRSWTFRGAFLGAGLVLVGGCDEKAAPPGDSVVAAAPQPEPIERSWTGSWAAELGDVLLVPSDTDNTAIVVYPDAPDAALLSAARLTLLTAGGEPALTAVSVLGTDTLVCGTAPVVRLSDGAFGTWAIGVAGNAGVIRTDSVEAMVAADSARLVASLARLASAATGSAKTRYTGLPFTVEGARRFTVGQTRVVAAHLVRRLPQEASPLEEHMLVIAERPLTSDTLRLTFSRRSEGTEETAEHFEVLSAVAGRNATFLLLARDTVSGTLYEILERDASGVWRVRWGRRLTC